MRPFVIGIFLLFFASQDSSLHAQGPFGRLGFGPGLGIRPPMPPVPVPSVYGPAPGYVRVPGIASVPSRYVVPVGPSIGYRSTTIVAVPLVPVVIPAPYSAARVAVVQPSSASVNVYRAGNAGYRTAPNPAAITASPPSSARSDDLRPGMVLPDGAVVVSVGQPNPVAASGQPSAGQAAPLSGAVLPTVPTPAPVPNPNPEQTSSTQSILEAEEIPKPSSSTSTNKPIEKSTKQSF